MIRRDREGAPLLTIAWSDDTDRTGDLALALGGLSRRYTGMGMRGGVTAPLRYAINGLRTTAWLIRARPRMVVTQNPPIFLPLLTWVLISPRGGRLILDSHPSAFGRKGMRFWKAMLPIHRYLARRSAAVLVGSEDLAAEVRSWGGNAVVLHEPPVPSPSVFDPVAEPSIRPLPSRPTVLFVGVFASDEPIGEVLEAAGALPTVDFLVTGDTRRADNALLNSAPPNVTWVGYLQQEDYQRQVRECDVVMALTTEDSSVVRAGYEAVYAGRPLITSRTPTLTATFPYAIHVANRAGDIAEGVREMLRGFDRIQRTAGPACILQERRWLEQIAAVREVTGPPIPNPSSPRTTDGPDDA